MGFCSSKKCLFEGICEHKCTSALTFERLLQQALLSPWPLSEPVFDQVDPLPPAPCRPAGSQGGNEAAGAVGCRGAAGQGTGRAACLWRGVFLSPMLFTIAGQWQP